MKQEDEFFISWLRKKFAKEFQKDLKIHRKQEENMRKYWAIYRVVRLLNNLKLDDYGKRYIDDRKYDKDFDFIRKELNWYYDKYTSRL